MPEQSHESLEFFFEEPDATLLSSLENIELHQLILQEEGNSTHESCQLMLEEPNAALLSSLENIELHQLSLQEDGNSAHESGQLMLEEPNGTNQEWNQVHRQLQEYQQSEISILPMGLLGLFEGPSFESPSSCEIHSKAIESAATTSTKPSPPSQKDYQKNLCTYISKKVVLQLLTPKSQKIVRRLCRQSNCSYEEVMDYYRLRVKQNFGNGHLNLMMTPQRQEEVGIKKVFRAFLVWFLRNRYMSYLVRDGKMEEKEIYIAFKNKFFLYVSRHQENHFNSTEATVTENGNCGI